MPVPQITNPGGAQGYTDLQTQIGAVYMSGLASADITGPAVVAIGTDGKVATAATDGTASLAVGITIRSVTSGYVDEYVALGIAENVPCNGAVARGDILKRSVTTAGYVAATATPGVGEAIGVAINASASNVVDVYVCKSFALS